MISNTKIIFNIYKKSIFEIENDLRFWKRFLTASIKTYEENDERTIHQAIFTAYDHEFQKIGGKLKRAEEVYETKTTDLAKRRNEFFIWVMNLSILKAYNSIEILLLQLIQLRYFDVLEDPINGKSQTDKVTSKICEVLKQNGIRPEKRNNRYLIDFLAMKSQKLNSFFELPMNVDLKTKWAGFFNFVSILRNVVAHCGMILHLDVKNEIKSVAKDIFERYFETSVGDEGLPKLSPRVEEFGNFINYLNSFSVSVLKFAFDQDNLNFIGLK